MMLLALGLALTDTQLGDRQAPHPPWLGPTQSLTGPAHASLPRLGGDDADDDEKTHCDIVESDDDDSDIPRTVDELRACIDEVMSYHNLPGVGLALVEAGRVSWVGGVGLADRARKRPVTADTVFRVASISKTVIALALMTLVEDGRVRLDTRVRDLAPEIAGQNRWAERDPITVAHLLEHSAGYDDMRFNELFIDPDDDPDDSSNGDPGSALHGDSDDPRAQPAPLADVLARNPRTRTSRWRPGSRFAYSNPGYTELAYLIEKLTGEPFEDYVARRVLRPMGMPSASFARSPALTARLAQGYGARNRPLAYRDIHHRPAGALLASPADIAQLVVLMLGRGQAQPAPGGDPSRPAAEVVSGAAIARMERSRTRPEPLLTTAYGLGVTGDASLPVFTRGHGGGLPGFVSEYRYASDYQLGYALLFNSTSPDLAAAGSHIRALVSAYLLRDIEIPAPPEVEVPPERLRQHLGFYELTNPRHQLSGFIERVQWSAEVVATQTGIALKFGNGARVGLIPTAPDRFRFRGFSAASVAFATRPDGRRVMQLDNLSYQAGDPAWGPLKVRALYGAYSLLSMSAYWNLLWIPSWLYLLIRLRQRVPLPPSAHPALASLSFFAMIKLFLLGLEWDVLGHVNAVSVGFLVLSVVFPLLSAVALVRTLRALRADAQMAFSFYEQLAEVSGALFSLYQRGWRSMLYDIATCAACVMMSIYLFIHGIIGFATWSW
ncbi:MAG: hypothetical protein Tsb0020_42950 [Haliangiales bacterium]